MVTIDEKYQRVLAALMLDGVDRETAEYFIRYHDANRQIWNWFEAFTIQAIRAGRKLGSKAIAERVRWEANMGVRKGVFKLNNNYPAYYARMFGMKYPQHKNYFNKRKVRGLKKEAA